MFTLKFPERYVAPEILPVVESNVSPSGSPDAVQVNGFVPLAFNVTLYFLPEVAFLSFDVEIVGAVTTESVISFEVVP